MPHGCASVQRSAPFRPYRYRGSPSVRPRLSGLLRQIDVRRADSGAAPSRPAEPASIGRQGTPATIWLIASVVAATSTIPTSRWPSATTSPRPSKSSNSGQGATATSMPRWVRNEPVRPIRSESPASRADRLKRSVHPADTALISTVIRPGLSTPSSPELSTIRPNRIFAPQIHTVTIRSKVRWQFGR